MATPGKGGTSKSVIIRCSQVRSTIIDAGRDREVGPTGDQGLDTGWFSRGWWASEQQIRRRFGTDQAV